MMEAEALLQEAEAVMMMETEAQSEMIMETEAEPEITEPESNDDLLDYIKSNNAQSTIKRTEQIFNRFLKFVSENEKCVVNLANILAMEPGKLDGLLGHWLISLKRENGEEYEPSSVVAYYGHIKRKLDQAGYECNIGTDKAFSLSRKVLSGKKKNLKKCGKGNKPNRAEALSPDDEEQLHTMGQFAFDNPECLQNFLWYSFTKGFGFRGCQEAKQLLWGDIELGKETDGVKYLAFTERTTKTRTGDTAHERHFRPKIFANEINERCPIQAYELYESHRPTAMLNADSPFFLSVIKNPISTSWYKSNAMGINTLQTIMKRMCTSANIHGKFTNHSLRRTVCNQLLSAGIHPNDVCQLTGHKNAESLNSYATTSLKKQREMSNILLNSSTQLHNVSDDSCDRSLTQQSQLRSLSSQPAASPARGSTNVCNSRASSTVINRPQKGFEGLFNNCSVSFTGPVTINISGPNQSN